MPKRKVSRGKKEKGALGARPRVKIPYEPPVLTRINLAGVAFAQSEPPPEPDAAPQGTEGTSPIAPGTLVF